MEKHPTAGLSRLSVAGRGVRPLCFGITVGTGAYLDPKSLQKNGGLGSFQQFWTMILHTFVVQVPPS